MTVPSVAVGPSWSPTDSLRALAQLVAMAIIGPSASSAQATDSSLRMPARPQPYPSARPNDATDAKSLRPAESDPPGEIEADHLEMWALVKGAQAGDGEAFGKLYDRYVDSVFRFVYYRVNDRALAEDFTSETFLRALRRISTINYQGRDIGAWFMTIARNIVFDHAKSARFRLELSTGEVPDRNDADPAPDLVVLTNLGNARLMRAINDLGDEQKECIVLRFLQELSVAETAEVMGKNDGAIKALQHRAVKRLAAILGDELR
jgi:RNA polymerase sigma-70 factor (ECF subfamily)